MTTFASWTRALSARGFDVLPSSHAVPVSLWLRDTGPGPAQVLHFAAAGTRFVLRAYPATDLTTLLLRSECDCESHRTAGAAARVVLAPGVRPVATEVFDGAAVFGWSSIEATRLPVDEVAGIFESLYAGRVTAAIAVPATMSA
jgi:hypothetical protein